MLFRNRVEAGRLLGARVAEEVHDADALVLGLPRGGVPVAFKVAERLGAPLDVLVVRKLGAPGHPELAIGAVAPGVTFIDEDMVDLLGIDPEFVDGVISRERRELVRRSLQFRAGVGPIGVRGGPVILVDDGIATGSTIRAGAECLRQMGAEIVIIAAPICAAAAAHRLRSVVPTLISVDEPEQFGAVAYWYEDFEQTEDDEVLRLLAKARSRAGGHAR